MSTTLQRLLSLSRSPSGPSSSASRSPSGPSSASSAYGSASNPSRPSGSPSNPSSASGSPSADDSDPRLSYLLAECKRLERTGYLTPNASKAIKDAWSEFQAAKQAERANAHSPSGHKMSWACEQEMDPARVDEIVSQQLRRYGKRSSDSANVLGSK